MPQDLPSWAEPYSPSPRPSPFDPAPDGSPFSDGAASDVGVPPPGPVPNSTDPNQPCDCDLDVLRTLVVAGVDCDADEESFETCQLVCCNTLFPNEDCHPALICPIPLPGEGWILLLGALLIGWWHLRVSPPPTPATS